MNSKEKERREKQKISYWQHAATHGKKEEGFASRKAACMCLGDFLPMKEETVLS